MDQAMNAREGCSMAGGCTNGLRVACRRCSPWGAAQEVAALNQAMDAHEGCNVAGWLDVQRVAGNFHISVHAEDFLMLTKVGAHVFIGQDRCLWSSRRMLAHVACRMHPQCYAQAQALRMQHSWH